MHRQFKIDFGEHARIAGDGTDVDTLSDEDLNAFLSSKLDVFFRELEQTTQALSRLQQESTIRSKQCEALKESL